MPKTMNIGMNIRSLGIPSDMSEELFECQGCKFVGEKSNYTDSTCPTCGVEVQFASPKKKGKGARNPAELAAAESVIEEAETVDSSTGDGEEVIQEEQPPLEPVQEIQPIVEHQVIEEPVVEDSVVMAAMIPNTGKFRQVKCMHCGHVERAYFRDKMNIKPNHAGPCKACGKHNQRWANTYEVK